MNVDFAPEGLLLRGFDVHAQHGVTPLAAAVLAAWSAGADGFELREDGLLLSAAALRNLAPEVLAELGVHALPGTVRVREVGLTGRPGYRWELLWDGEAGLPYGVWLQRAGRLYLMDEARLTLARLAGEVEGATREEALANMREAAEGWLEAQQDKIDGGGASQQVELINL